MANGLFSSPLMIQAMEAHQRAQSSGLPAHQQGLVELGRTVGQLPGQFFGQDFRSPVERQAADIQAAVQGLDFTNKEDVLRTVQELSNQGNTQAAVELMRLVPQEPEAQDQWVNLPPLTVNGETVYFRKNLKNGRTEQVTKFGRPPSEGNGADKVAPWKPIKLSDLDIDSEIGWWFNNSQVGGEGFLSDHYEAADLKPVIGDQLRIANQLKRKALQAARDAGDPNPIFIDQDFMLEAASLMMEDPEAWFKEAITKGAKTKLRTNSRVSADSLLKLRDLRQRKEAATKEAESQALQARNVRPGARGVFSPNSLNRRDALNLFQEVTDPQETINKIGDLGFTLTEQQQTQMLPIMEAIQNNQGFTNNIIRGSIKDIPQIRTDHTNNNKLLKENPEKWIEQLVLLNFLSKINYGR